MTIDQFVQVGILFASMLSPVLLIIIAIIGSQKLDIIHLIVNSRLGAAMDKIDFLEAALRAIAERDK